MEGKNVRTTKVHTGKPAQDPDYRDYSISERSYFLVLHILKVLFLLDLYQCKMCRVFFSMIKQKTLHLHKFNTCCLINVYLFTMVMLHTANENSSLWEKEIRTCIVRKEKYWQGDICTLKMLLTINFYLK